MPSKDELIEIYGQPTRREPFVSRNMRGETIAVQEDHYLWFRCGCHAFKMEGANQYRLRPCYRRECPQRGKTPA